MLKKLDEKRIIRNFICGKYSISIKGYQNTFLRFELSDF